MASNDLINQISTNYNYLNSEISDVKSMLSNFDVKLDNQSEKLDLVFNVVEGDGRAGLKEQLITLNTKFELFEKEIEANRSFKRSVWLAFITTGLGILGVLIKTIIT